MVIAAFIYAMHDPLWDVEAVIHTTTGTPWFVAQKDRRLGFGWFCSGKKVAGSYEGKDLLYRVVMYYSWL